MAKLFGSNGGSKKRTLKVEYDKEQGFWRVAGPTAGYGAFQTKAEAKRKAEQVFNEKDLYSKLAVHTRDGAVQTSQSIGYDSPSEDNGSESRVQTFKKGVSAASKKVGSKSREFAEKAAEYEGEREESDETNDERSSPFGGAFDLGGESNNERSGPALFGGGRDESENQGPQMGFMGSGGNNSGPSMPGFGMEREEGDDDDEEFRFPGF